MAPVGAQEKLICVCFSIDSKYLKHLVCLLCLLSTDDLARLGAQGLPRGEGEGVNQLAQELHLGLLVLEVMENIF